MVLFGQNMMNDENEKPAEAAADTAVSESEAPIENAIENEEPMTRDVNAPPAPDPTFERRAVRRGCFSIIFGAVLGAIVGAVLTLSLLSWLNNGTLTYNQASVQLHNELDDAVATRAVVMADLMTRQAESEATMASAAQTVEAGMATTEAEVARMQVTAVYLETRIGQAGNAADTLDAFLAGLDELVSDVETTPTPAP